MQAQTIIHSILIHDTFHFFFGALFATATTATGKSAPNNKTTTTRNTNESLI